MVINNVLGIEVQRRLKDITDIKVESGESVKRSKEAKESADISTHRSDITSKQVTEALKDGDQVVEVQTLRVDPVTGAVYNTATDRFEANQRSVTQQLEEAGINLTDRGINVRRPPYNIKTGTDMTAQMTELIQGVPDHAELIFPEGTYIFNLLIKKPITITGVGEVVFKGVDGVGAPIVKFEGSVRETYETTSLLERGNKTVNIRDNTTIETGDYILLRDDSRRASDNYSEVNLEVHRVDTAGNGFINLQDFVRLPKKTSPTGVRKLNMLKGIKLSGITFEHFPNALSQDPDETDALKFIYCADVTVSDVIARNVPRDCVKFETCHNVTLDGFDFSNPQAIGGGQGYGVLSRRGTSFITIRNGLCNGMRHAVDFANAFSGYVENVTSVNNMSVAFVISHNGYDSDIHFNLCRSYDNSGAINQSGFQASSQGFPTRYDATIYDIKITNCEVVLGSGSMFQSGVHIAPVCHGLYIGNLEVRVENNNVISPDSRGITLFPFGTKATIENSRFIGLGTGIRQYDVHSLLNVGDNENIYIKNVELVNCLLGIMIGLPHRVFMDNISFMDCVQNTQLTRYSDSTIQVIDLTMTNITTNKYESGKFNFVNIQAGMNNVDGIVSGIKTTGVDSSKLSVVITNRITAEKLFVSNGLINFTGVAGQSIGVIDKFVKGYRVTFLNTSKANLIISHANNIKNIGNENMSLSPQQSTEYIFDGSNWVQLR